MARWNFFNYFRFPAASPKKVKGGIKAQSKRGAFAANWWAKRWLKVLESFHLGARLQRGRSYARGGQVVDLEIDKGRVTAWVQGSRSRPYKVAVALKTLPPEAWSRVVKALSSEFRYMAQLINGDLPPAIEEVFRQVKVPLFPDRGDDLKTECSCPDWSNPCKHIAAVFYLLGEEFDRDPFLLFKLRGLSRRELLERLGGRGEEDAGGEGSKEEKEMLAVGEPLLPEESSFWGRESFEQLLEGVAIPAMSAMLPRRLGNFPFWRGGEPFLESLEPFYLQGAGAGLRVFLGEGPPGEEETKVSAKALEPVRKARASRKNLKKKPATRQPLRKARKSKSG